MPFSWKLWLRIDALPPSITTPHWSLSWYNWLKVKRYPSKTSMFDKATIWSTVSMQPPSVKLLFSPVPVRSRDRSALCNLIAHQNHKAPWNYVIFRCMGWKQIVLSSIIALYCFRTCSDFVTTMFSTVFLAAHCCLLVCTHHSSDSVANSIIMSFTNNLHEQTTISPSLQWYIYMLPRVPEQGLLQPSSCLCVIAYMPWLSVWATAYIHNPKTYKCWMIPQLDSNPASREARKANDMLRN